jgi:hypothetical protein
MFKVKFEKMVKSFFPKSFSDKLKGVSPPLQIGDEKIEGLQIGSNFFAGTLDYIIDDSE